MKKAVVTGCSGFIGSNVCDYLLKKNYNVIGLDNLSTGNKKFNTKATFSKNFKFYKIDLLNDKIDKYFKNVDIVFHLAANADVRFGLNHRNKDIEQNIIVTQRILECIVKFKVKKIIFSSTGSVYGEAKNIPTSENTAFPIQTSLYGASKLAAEGLISAYSEGYEFQSYIFRFVSILGERYSHGHIFDFIKNLKRDPSKLVVLGDGTQRKSYLNIEDCVSGIFKSLDFFKKKNNIINLGTNEYSSVKNSIKIICKIMKIKPKIIYTGGKRGWVGDNPFIFLDTKKIRSCGWKPNYTINESIKITADYLLNNLWLLKRD